MRMRAVAIATAVVTASAGTAFTVSAASGTETSKAGTVSAASGQRGIKWFQAKHHLRATGKADAATTKALQKAPTSELRQAFRDPIDLGPAEKENARTVIGVGKGANIPEQGQVIALMTAMQESKFVNYTTPVDHDSLGIFQQRPSTGWGTPEQITDVPTSTKSFYGVAPFGSNPGLIQIPDWQNRPPGEVAQAVQRSAYPDRYAQWEGFARDFLAQEGPSVPPIS